MTPRKKKAEKAEPPVEEEEVAEAEPEVKEEAPAPNPSPLEVPMTKKERRKAQFLT